MPSLAPLLFQNVSRFNKMSSIRFYKAKKLLNVKLIFLIKNCTVSTWNWWNIKFRPGFNQNLRYNFFSNNLMHTIFTQLKFTKLELKAWLQRKRCIDFFHFFSFSVINFQVNQRIKNSFLKFEFCRFWNL